MDIELSSEDLAFRDEVRAFFDENKIKDNTFTGNNPYIKKPKVEHMLLNLFARKLCNAKVKAPNNGPK